MEIHRHFPDMEYSLVEPIVQRLCTQTNGWLAARIDVLKFCIFRFVEAFIHLSTAVGKSLVASVLHVQSNTSSSIVFLESRDHAMRAARCALAILFGISAFIRPNSVLTINRWLALDRHSLRQRMMRMTKAFFTRLSAQLNWKATSTKLSWKVLGIYGVALSLVTLPLSLLLAQFSSHTGIGFGPYLPDRIFRLAESQTNVIKTVISLLGINAMMRTYPLMGLCALNVVLSSLEEVIFRGLWQEVLMRRIPKAILSQVSPKHLPAIDSKVGKIVRVVASSFIFAISHTDLLSPMRGGGLPQFFSGLIYGSLVESRQGIMESTIAHIGKNSVVDMITLAMIISNPQSLQSRST